MSDEHTHDDHHHHEDHQHSHEDEKEKKLALMRYWLFGSYMIFWAGTFAFIGIFTDMDFGAAFRTGWPIWLIILLLCVVLYVGYAFVLNREES